MAIYLLFFFFLYLILTMLLPRWRVAKQTGQAVFVVPRDDSAQGFIGKIFRFLFLLVPVILIVHAFLPQWELYLLPATFLETKVIYLTGMVILHLSLIVIVIAQYQMNLSWRVGFDEKQQTKLVSRGLFQYSRNPIFLGMLLTLSGLFLVLPNALTMLVAALAYVVLQIQIRLEEEYLVRVHGNNYLDYKQRVRRWI